MHDKYMSIFYTFYTKCENLELFYLKLKKELFQKSLQLYDLKSIKKLRNS